MNIKNTLAVIRKAELHERVSALKDSGYRLAQICCAKDPYQRETPAKRYEMSYSFGKEQDMLTFRFDLVPGEEIRSITGIYDGAYLYENELHDLYGIAVLGINVDFKGTLYKVAVPTPFDPAQGRAAEASASTSNAERGI